MKIERMENKHRSAVREMADQFYNSPALSHPVDAKTIDTVIDTAINQIVPNYIGYVITEEDKVAGFGYVTEYFETEIAGMCVMTLDLYIDPQYRKKGYAKKYFEFVFNKYSYAKRFRLEVTKENRAAKALYEKLGYKYLEYDQMVIDVK